MVSTRRGDKKQYEEGDRIEILRADGVDVGQLLGKAKAKPSDTMAHWMVLTNGVEELVSEHSLGRVLELESDGSTMSIDPRMSSAKTTSIDAATPKPVGNVKSSATTTTSKTAVAAAKLVAPVTKTRAMTRSKGADLWTGIEAIPVKKVAPTKKLDKNVTKVQLRTGVLYLYRGKQYRAEFVRTK